MKLVSLLMREGALGRQSENRVLSGDDDRVRLGDVVIVVDGGGCGCELRARTSRPLRSMPSGTGSGWRPTVFERTRGGGAAALASVRVGGSMSEVELVTAMADGGREGRGRVGAGGAVDMAGKGKAASSSGMSSGAGVGPVSLKSASARLAARTASSSGGEREVVRLRPSSGGAGDGSGVGRAGTDHTALGERARCVDERLVPS